MKNHLCHIFPNFGVGGPEVRTVLLMNALTERFRHTVIALNGNLQMQHCVSPNVEVEYCNRPIAGGWLQRIRTLGRLLREISPDLLLTYGWGGTDALMSARTAGVRSVIHTEDGFLPDEVVRQKRRRLYYRRLLFRSALKLIVPSRTLELIAKKLWWIPEGKLSYIPNGVNTDRYSPIKVDRNDNSLARALGLDRARLVIGTVGALRPEKNHARLIRTTAELLRNDDVHLLLVGEGCERERLRNLAEQLGVLEQVHFSGNVSDPAPYYRLMDLFALTSDTEQMPISLLEAMATGLPVAATDVGDVLDMVADSGKPFIIPSENESDLVQSIRDLVSNSTLRDRLGADNRLKCLQEFSEQAMIDRYAEQYVAAIESGGKKRTVSASVSSIRE